MADVDPAKVWLSLTFLTGSGETVSERIHPPWAPVILDVPDNCVKVRLDMWLESDDVDAAS